MGEGGRGHFVCAVSDFSVQKCQRPAHCLFVCSRFPFLFRVLDGGRSDDMARSTNKQTEGIKIEKNRADEKWQCVFIAVRLMASSSHYSPVCPLPPIGCNNIVWHGGLPVSRHLKLLLNCMEDKGHFTPGSTSSTVC